MRLKDGVFTQVTVVRNGVEVVIAYSIHVRKAMNICDQVSKSIAGKGIVVTAILDGKHKEGSKHYIGEAFDVRSFIYTKEQITELLAAFKQALGKDYDVIFEGDHFHVEYDPK